MIIDELGVLFKQKTAYEMRISDWSSDVCSSDLLTLGKMIPPATQLAAKRLKMPLCSAPRDLVMSTSFTACIIVLILSQKKKELQIGRASCRERVCQYV